MVSKAHTEFREYLRSRGQTQILDYRGKGSETCPHEHQVPFTFYVLPDPAPDGWLKYEGCQGCVEELAGYFFTTSTGYTDLRIFDGEAEISSH